jgi:hypothetical protein
VQGSQRRDVCPEAALVRAVVARSAASLRLSLSLVQGEIRVFLKGET